MKITVTIDSGNAAIVDEAGEVERILTEAAQAVGRATDRVVWGISRADDEGILWDVNGNRVGSWSVEP